MWESVQVTATVLGLITAAGTIGSWFVAGRNRGNRVPSRQRPKGAWERAAALSALTRISDDPYIESMAASAAKIATEAEAFAAVRNHVKLPIFMAVAYFGLGVLAVWPSFDPVMLLVSLVGMIVFLGLSSVNALRNMRNKLGVHTLVEEENDLVLRNPFEALRQHASTAKGKQEFVDRILGKGLRFLAVKISKQQEELKRRAADLDERELDLERRERDLSANWTLRRG